MNFAQEKQGASRFTGIGIVILVHIVIIYGLASGLAKKAVEKLAGPIETKVIEEKVKPPPPPEKVVPPPPDIKAPPPPFVPPPEFQVTAPVPPAPAMTTTTVAPPAQPFRPAPAAAPTPAPAPAPYTGPVKAGMVCTKMGKLEAPSVNWSGDALYKVTAKVTSGRVVSAEIQSMRTGVDRKAERTLKQAILAHLQETYECPGDHIFEQEFQFRIE
jgi:protein TonB